MDIVISLFVLNCKQVNCKQNNSTKHLTHTARLTQGTSLISSTKHLKSCPFNFCWVFFVDVEEK